MRFDDFLIPQTMEEAREALNALGEKGYAFAGGTAFQYVSDRPGATAVDITRLGLRGIEPTDGGFRVGATTTLTDLVRYRADGWVLDRVATRIPTHQVRNISTVGGNISRLFPWSDLPLALLVLEGGVVILGDDGERAHDALEFFTAQPLNRFGHGDLVTAVEVPAVAPPLGFGFKKENTTNAAFALMTGAAAITLDGERMARVRLAANGALAVPQRLPDVEAVLEGEPADAGLFAAAVEGGIGHLDWRGREGMSNEFARHLGGVILVDVLEQALAAAKGGAE